MAIFVGENPIVAVKVGGLDVASARLASLATPGEFANIPAAPAPPQPEITTITEETIASITGENIHYI